MLIQDEIRDYIKKHRDILDRIGPEYLNDYIYIYRAPRDGKVFYVGKGRNSRAVSHLMEAFEAEFGASDHTAKTRRIAEIWSADEQPDYQIISRKHSEKDAEVAEAAVMAAVSISQNGPLLNLQSGQHGAVHGPIRTDELETIDAQPFNPSEAIAPVLLFPIHNALGEGQELYEATRGSWSVTETWRERSIGGVAVGLVQGQSKCAFKISGWEPSDLIDKWKLKGEPVNAHSVDASRWTAVLNAARGFYLRGNWIAAEFDGVGNFQILRGSSNPEWHPIE